MNLTPVEWSSWTNSWLPKIIFNEILDIIILIIPNAGIINIYTSGCPKNQIKEKWKL
jgi:hypothetical protein